jgi:hypothetical protein
MKNPDSVGQLVPYGDPEILDPLPEPLTDAALIKGGLEKTEAWVRTEQSKAALRQAKAREKQNTAIAEMLADSGEGDPVKTVQANLGQLPEPVAKHLRALAKAVRSGASMSEAVATLPGVEPIATKEIEIERVVERLAVDPLILSAVHDLRETVIASVKIGGFLVFFSGLALGFSLGLFAAWWF